MFSASDVSAMNAHRALAERFQFETIKPLTCIVLWPKKKQNRNNNEPNNNFIQGRRYPCYVSLTSKAFQFF